MYTGNHTLITMTARHFISYGNLSLLRNVASYNFIYSWRKFIFAVFARKHFNIDNYTIFSVRNS